MHKHQHHSQKQRKETKTMICHSDEFFSEWWPIGVATLNSESV